MKNKTVRNFRPSKINEVSLDVLTISNKLSISKLSSLIIQSLSPVHAQAQAVWDKLSTEIDLRKYIVICAGDMAGILNIYGEDADPTQTYQFIADRAKALYIIQGNHDLPPKNLKDLTEMKNKNGTYCYLPDGKSIKTELGKIGGVHGIISDKVHPYKKHLELYLKFLNRVLVEKLDILVTHDTPSVIYDNKECVGNKEIYELVKKYKQRVHIYGHCHHPFFYHRIENTHFFNVDARILIIDRE